MCHVHVHVHVYIPLEVSNVTFVVVVVDGLAVDLISATVELGVAISAMVELGVAEGSIDRRTSIPITHCSY